MTVDLQYQLTFTRGKFRQGSQEIYIFPGMDAAMRLADFHRNAESLMKLTVHADLADLLVS